MFKKGNVFAEHGHRGWFYGEFMEKGLNKDNRAEIKVVDVDKNFTSSYHSQKVATKLDIVWRGEAVWEVEGKEVVLKDGDYLIIPPGTKTRVKEVISQRLIVQTIKIPSISDDKRST